jgi:hypothetical protein
MNRIRLLKNTTDFTDFEDLLHDFLDYAQKYMDLKQVPEIEFVHDEHNGKDILGKTAQYDPNSMEIHVYSYGRHPKDMLRSIAHELVHHMQNEQGRLNVGGYHGQGYAQKNPALREIEKEAMLQSNLCLRDWEDGLKEQKRTIYKEWRNNTMSLKEWKNKELNTLLIEKWGFGSIEEQVEEVSEENVKMVNSDDVPKDADVVVPDGRGDLVGIKKEEKIEEVTAEEYRPFVKRGIQQWDRTNAEHPLSIIYNKYGGDENSERAMGMVHSKLISDYVAIKKGEHPDQIAMKGKKVGTPAVSRVDRDNPGLPMDAVKDPNEYEEFFDPKAPLGQRVKTRRKKVGDVTVDDRTMEERLTKEIAAKMLQNESLLNKLRGK